MRRSVTGITAVLRTHPAGRTTAAPSSPLGPPRRGLRLTLLLGPGGVATATLISAATQPTFEELAYFARTASARRAARAQRAIDVTAASAGWTADEVVRTALSDDRLLELTSRALTAAAEAATNAKIDALGRALAAGLLADDPARVDSQVLVQSVALTQMAKTPRTTMA